MSTELNFEFESSITDENGATRVPAELRRAMGVGKGDKIKYKVRDGRVILEKK